MENFIPLEGYGLKYNVSFVDENDPESDQLLYLNDVLVARNKFKLCEGSQHVSYLCRHEELDPEGNLHGRIMDIHEDGDIIMSTTFKHGAEHGVRFVLDKYDDPDDMLPEYPISEEGEKYNRFFFEGEELFRPAYWFKKNLTALKSGKFAETLKAFTAPNEMTMKDLNGPKKPVVTTDSLTI